MGQFDTSACRGLVRSIVNINSFWSLAQARVVIADWKHGYNHRHRFLGLAELLCDVA